MNGYLLDTNHLTAAVDGKEAVRSRIEQLRLSGARIGLIVPVLCEYEVGLQQTKRVKHNRMILDALLRHLRIWQIDEETAIAYGKLYRELQSIGRSWSQVDMMIGAMARQRNLCIATSDLDFEALPDIKTENWLT